MTTSGQTFLQGLVPSMQKYIKLVSNPESTKSTFCTSWLCEGLKVPGLLLLWGGQAGGAESFSRASSSSGCSYP